MILCIVCLLLCFDEHRKTKKKKKYYFPFCRSSKCANSLDLFSQMETFDAYKNYIRSYRQPKTCSRIEKGRESKISIWDGMAGGEAAKVLIVRSTNVHTYTAYGIFFFGGSFSFPINKIDVHTPHSIKGEKKRDEKMRHKENENGWQ